MDYCVKDKDTNSKTCYEKDTLIKIAKQYNNNHSDKINLKSKNLYENIKKKLNKDSPCSKDICWLNIDYLDELKPDLLKTLRPEVPENWYNNKEQWLNTLDIMSVMKQYEKKHNDFIFLGASPKDYDFITYSNQCVSNELCKFSLSNHLKNGKKKIGLIFNTDNHNEGGQHWVSIFIDLNKCGIYYVDSVGEEPLDNFIKFMNKVKCQGDSLIYNNKININDIDNDHMIIDDYEQLSDTIISVPNANKYKIGNIINLCNNKKLNCNNNYKIINICDNNLLLDKKIKNKSKNIIQKTFRIFHSKIQHQKGNNECGMYSIHFIDNMINGMNFYNYVKNRKSDKYMNELRYSKYFLPIRMIPKNNYFGI